MASPAPSTSFEKPESAEVEVAEAEMAGEQQVPTSTAVDKPAAEDAKPAAEDAKPAAEDAKPAAEDAKPAAEDVKPENGSEERKLRPKRRRLYSFYEKELVDATRAKKIPTVVVSDDEKEAKKIMTAPKVPIRGYTRPRRMRSGRVIVPQLPGPSTSKVEEPVPAPKVEEPIPEPEPADPLVEKFTKATSTGDDGLDTLLKYLEGSDDDE